MDRVIHRGRSARTRSIEHRQVDTHSDHLNRSERFVRTLSSSRGRTSPPQHGVAPRRLGEALCLAVHFRRGWLGIDCIRRSTHRIEINRKRTPAAHPYSFLKAVGLVAVRTRPTATLGATTREGSTRKRPAAHEMGTQWATRESYGMAVVVRASSSLFSLRRCVSKRSPTLNDVTFTKLRPVRL